METHKNIQKVSFLFFAILGGLYLLMNLMVANGYLPQLSSLTKKLLDLPVIFTGLIYGLSSIRNTLATDKEKHTILDAVLVAIGGLLFITALILNFAFPNV